MSIQDAATAEEVEQVTQSDPIVDDSTANLLSSG